MQKERYVRHGTLPDGKVKGSVCLEKNASPLKRQIRFIDHFEGCSGLLEGFIQAGYAPFAHVVIDQNTWRGR